MIAEQQETRKLSLLEASLRLRISKTGGVTRHVRRGIDNFLEIQPLITFTRKNHDATLYLGTVVVGIVTFIWGIYLETRGFHRSLFGPTPPNKAFGCYLGQRLIKRY